MTDSAEPSVAAKALAVVGDPLSGRVAQSVLEGGGEMGALMRSVDWAATPIGAVQTWPQSLRTVLGILLASEQPVFVCWGPEMVQFYNDAYRPILGTKMHPAAMGQLARECWIDIWPVVKPMFDKVFAGGATSIKDGPLFLGRSGFLEECFFDYALNPIRDETGAVAGIFVVANETTSRVIGERRLGLLRDLSLRLALARDAAGVLRSVEQVLAQTPFDVPFALLYEVSCEVPGDVPGEVTGNSAQLIANAGLTRGTPAAPARLMLSEGGSWPLGAVAESGREILVEGLDTTFGPLVAGPWPEPVTRALVLPLSQGDGGTAAVLVVGLSPRLPPDDDYRSFIQLLARQIAASLSSARAHAQETQRAADLARLDRAKIAFFSNVSHESLFMQAPIAIAILEGLRLTFVFANAAYRALVGGRDVLGQPLLEALPELAGQGLDALIETVMTTGVPFIGTEIPVNLDRTGTGTREDCFFNVVYSPRRAASGGVDGVLVWGIDVTEQVVARRLIESLLKQLKVADRRKDEFLATLAHELRNPLAAISAAVEVLARLDGKPIPSRVLDIVRRQNKQLIRLVEDLLDVSSVTEGKVLLQRRPTPVADFVQQAVDACQTEIAGRRHRLSVKIDAGPLLVDGDPVRLTQIITNLLQNAAKYTPEGGQISVQARREGAQVEIRIRDNGAGITAEALPHVFDLFVQDERPLSRAQGGLGIGLTVVQRMVEMHGGTVQARSGGLDCGSEFIVKLPAVEAPESFRIAPGEGVALAPCRRES